MLIKVFINWGIVGQNLHYNRGLEILKPIWTEFFPESPQLSWAQLVRLQKIDIKDTEKVSLFVSNAQKRMRANEFMQELIYDISSTEGDLIEADWYIVRNFADDASNAEITHHTDSEMICPACGNDFQNAYFVPAIRPEKLPGSPKLMSFYGPMKLFCRQPFLEMYHKSGLTGFSFEDWEICDKHKVPLHLIRVQQHQWQDRTGVCDRCQMKTNVTTPVGLFNVHEQFKYDIQHVRTYRSDAFVISRRGVQFLSRVCRMMKGAAEPPYYLFPVIPGYLEDIISPEPKLFAQGDIPLHMLRSSWERSSE